jgi:hypothetical protein
MRVHLPLPVWDKPRKLKNIQAASDRLNEGRRCMKTKLQGRVISQHPVAFKPKHYRPSVPSLDASPDDLQQRCSHSNRR